MAPQTRLNYNELMFAVHDVDYRYKDSLITGAGALLKGQVLVFDAGKYRAALDADRGVLETGWRILLADADPSGGDVTAPAGITGGINDDMLVGAGLTLDDYLFNILENNRIIVQGGTNAIQVAGEDV
jgi:hypothetical protein